MRVLIIPELYRPSDASANATLNDAVTWVEEWLRLDRSLHAYWLLPHRGTANYEREYVLADRDRVTLIEAESLMGGEEYETLFTETGYTKRQLQALKRRVYDQLGYVDIVVDQLRQGRATLYKWLLYLSGHRAGEPSPFSLIANVHDLMLPFKYPSDGYRADYHRALEVVEAVFSDGIWFKARLDADEMPVFGHQFLQSTVLMDALDAAVLTDSPIDFSRFEERYADRPEWLHVAGSSWEKKHNDIVMEIAGMLYDRYEIRTVMTSMDEIPRRYQRLPYVEAHSEAPRDLFEQILRRGDIAICATEYDTLARTWFEQAASGQVLLLRDEPWIADCVPEGHPLVAPAADLADLAIWTVEHWEEAVAANRDLVEYVGDVRSPERSGRKTHDDMRWRVEEKVEQYAALYERKASKRKTIRRTVERIDSATIGLDELNERGARLTRDGEPLVDQTWCSITDLVFTLRAMGYADTGNPGTPLFRRPTDGNGADD